MEHILSQNTDTVSITAENLDKIVDFVVNEGINKHRILVSEVVDFRRLVFPNVIFHHVSKKGWEEKIEFHTNVERRELTATLYQRLNNKSSYIFMYQYKWHIQEIVDNNASLSIDSKLLDCSKYCSKEELFAYVNEQEKEAGSYIDLGMWRFFYVNYFVRTIPTSYTQIDREVKTTISSGKGIHKKYKSVTKIVHDYKININAKKKDFVKIFTCLAWGVRGHFRTIINKKTGKVSKVFVKPYIKGKERNNPDAYIAKNYGI